MMEKVVSDTAHKCKKSLIWSDIGGGGGGAVTTTVSRFCSILYVSINIYKFKNSVLFNGKLPLSNVMLAHPHRHQHDDVGDHERLKKECGKREVTNR